MHSIGLPSFLDDAVRDGSPLLLAISGGIDSVVLAHLLHDHGYPFVMAHCNFHLRSGDCDRDELFVRRLADQYHVAIHVAEFATADFAAANHLGIEDAARRLRYDFFESLRQQYGYSAILTAHHRDDATETFFLNLIRGTGLNGLHGILPVHGHILRPLLDVSRAEIESYARYHQLEHVEDYTNADLDFRRNRIRHQLMPLLRDISPAVDKTLHKTILHLQGVEGLYGAFIDNLRSQVMESLPGQGMRLSLPLPFPNHAPQLLFELLRPYGFNMSQVRDILSASQSGCRFYSSTHIALYDRHQLILSPIECCSNDIEGESKPLPDLRIECLSSAEAIANALSMVKTLPPNRAFLDADKVAQPLSLRYWREGDRFQPYGMPHGSQLISDYFSDHKYSLADKKKQLLLVDSDGVIHWIVSQRTSHLSRITKKTTRILSVSLVVESANSDLGAGNVRAQKTE